MSWPGKHFGMDSTHKLFPNDTFMWISSPSPPKNYKYDKRKWAFL